MLVMTEKYSLMVFLLIRTGKVTDFCGVWWSFWMSLTWQKTWDEL